jgi:hypothetical protein
MIRPGLYRPVHAKTLRSQKLRVLLTHRGLLQSNVHLMSALPPFERWRPARFTLFLKLNTRFSLPMSSIALNSRDGKDHRLSRRRHHRRVRIRLLAIGTDEAQMTISMPAANSQRSSTSQARAGSLC